MTAKRRLSIPNGKGISEDILEATIREATGATTVRRPRRIQDLWSGYGKLLRYELEGGERPSVVVKHILPPTKSNRHDKKSFDISHRRKLQSYRVEMAFYQGPARRCDHHCRIPHCLYAQSDASGMILILEDLNAIGFTGRQHISQRETSAVLCWLAFFHARFLNTTTEGLWKTGTYWHLDTRRNEWKQIDDLIIRNAAAEINALLSETRYQTLVHGDAKSDNFCFSRDGQRAAAVDFQYVGGGAGIRDVAYFLEGVLSMSGKEQEESKWLDVYFGFLHEGISLYSSDVSANAIEAEWRPLFRVAVADFYRFLKGWSPSYCRPGDYGDRVTREVIAGLNRTAERS